MSGLRLLALLLSCVLLLLGCSDETTPFDDTAAAAGGSGGVGGAGGAGATASGGMGGAGGMGGGGPCSELPQVSDITPDPVCSGVALSFDFVGTGFTTSTAVAIDGTPATVTFVSDTQLTVDVSAGLLPGIYDAVVSNGAGCETTATGLVNVDETPIMIFVTPSVIWDGADTPVTIFGANVTAPIADVSLRLTATNDPLTVLAFTPAPGNPDRPVAVVPANTPAGVYDVIVTDDGGCPATLTAALTVTDDASLELVSVTPQFANNATYTALTITATTNAPSTGFVGLPAVSLTGGGLTAPAQLESVSVTSPTSLSAALAPGIPPGLYDILVVNENGTIGTLTGALTVLNDQDVPKIDAVSPTLISNTVAGETVTITGADFDLGTVTLQCIDGSGTALTDQVLSVSASSATSITAVVDATLADYSSGANCIVVVANTNNAEAVYSAVVIVTSQTNLTGFVAGPDMTTPRRGLGALSGNASDAARFVYGVAGDDGTNALATVDSIAVDIFGQPAVAFTEQQYQLNTARTMVGAVAIGRFFYVVGGATDPTNTTAALASVERAAVLDATFRPRDLNVALDPSLVDGLGGGVYNYRVSAVMDVTDPFNPGGETLPSDAFGVALPTLGGGYNLQVTLTWDAVAGAVGYRIYRTVADAAPGTATLIADTTQTLPAEVTCAATSCTDLGATPGADAPLAVGATGVWTSVASLNVARQGAGVVAAVDPVNADEVHIYALGGLDATNNTLASYEYLTVTVAADGSQSFANSWTTGAQSLVAGRWRLGAYSATQADTANLDGTYVWAGGGATPTNTMVTNFEGAQVQTGGELGAFVDTGPANPAAAGYAAFSAGNFIYGLGGENGLPSVNSFSADHTGTPPNLGLGNNFDPGLNVPRVDVGATIMSGYFYSLGGTTTGNVVTASTEFVLY